MAVLDIILEGRAPKGGGGRGGRGGGGGGGSSPKNNNNNSSSRKGGYGGVSSGNRTSGNNYTGMRVPPAAWFMDLPIWARVLIVIGIIWACIIIITLIRFLFVEYKRHRKTGETFNILRVLKNVWLVACGGYIILFLLRPCTNRINSKKESTEKGGTFYEKVNDAERGQLDDEDGQGRRSHGKRPLSPTLAPSPPASPILKPAAGAK